MFLEIHDMTPPERMDVHARYGIVSDALMWTIGKPPAGIKAAMNMLGVPGGVPRDHIEPLTRDENAQLRDVLLRAGVLDERIKKSA